jgi:hypothetical protein
MSEQNTIVPHKPLVKASTELSAFLGMEPAMMIDTIKAQCFKGKRPDEVSDAQLATYISVANALKLNPLLPGMMYPFPDRNGSVTVMLGPDGVYTLLANNPDIVATKDGDAAWWTEHGKDAAGKETCTAYVNHRTKGLLKKTIWVDEWVVSSNPNWNTRRHHMAETRALKQVTRMVIHGVPFDEDERRIAEEVNVTHSVDAGGPPDKPGEPVGGATNIGESTVKRRGRPPGRSATGAAAVVDTEPATVTESKAIDIQATATPEAKAETPKAAEKPAKAAPEHAAEPVKPITGLIAGERKPFANITVDEIVAQNFGTAEKPRLAVKATVSGAFAGLVYDTRAGSAAWTDDKDPAKGVKAYSPWQLDHPINLVLVGKNRPDGTVANVVESAEIAEGTVQEAGELP